MGNGKITNIPSLTSKLGKKCGFELVSSKRYKLACLSIKDSDQPGHPLSLISIFDVCSVGSQGSIVSSDCANVQTYD